MIEEPFWSSGRRSSAEPGAGARAHQRDVVGDLDQRDGDHLQRARELDQGVAVALRLEAVERRGDLEPGRPRRACARTRSRELGVRVEPGAGGGAAERDLADAPQGRADALRARA